VRRRLVQVGRALRLRCPLCDEPWPRQGRLSLAAQCPRCDLYLERRENDFFLGSYTVNLFAALLVAVAVALANVRWIDVAPPLRWGASTLAIAAFAWWFHPIGKMLWLVIDVQFRPPMSRDFEEPPE
jgi:uncharacterized protein (DUF983 family)